MSLDYLFREEEKLRGTAPKPTEADIAIQNAEAEFKSMLGDTDESEEDRLRREDFFALQEQMGKLKTELQKCKRAKNARKYAEFNRKVGEKRKRIMRDIEDIKIKLQDLQYELQGSMMNGGDLMKMQTMTDDEKNQKKNEFRERMEAKKQKMKNGAD